jgi:hypothetical protein
VSGFSFHCGSAPAETRLIHWENVIDRQMKRGIPTGPGLSACAGAHTDFAVEKETTFVRDVEHTIRKNDVASF